MTVKLSARLALSGASFLLLSTASASHAATNYVLNGIFETNSGIGQIGPNSGPNISLTSWERTIIRDPGSEGFAFVINANADSTGFPSVFSDDYTPPRNIKIFGPGNGIPNGFPIGTTAYGPDGNVWLGIDGDYGRSSIKQTISGLTAAEEYELSFVWAGSQFTDVPGDTQQKWEYVLDGTTYSTTQIDVPAKGFVGWFKETKKFFASGNPFDLIFTAIGEPGPGALPPFLMLDNLKIETTSTPPPPAPAVPGPLPLLGMGAAFACSRKLRRRLSQASPSRPNAMN
jgi:hypothetical protein